MAGSTKVNQQQVQQTASKHDEARENIENRLKQLQGEISGHLPANTSDMAQAVTTGYEDLQTEIKNKIMTDLEQMGQAMRKVAADQSDTDTSSGRSVQQAAGGGGAGGGSPVTSFLSG